MFIREFLIVHEYGTVIFHKRYFRVDSEKDIVIRSGLISALFNFAKEVENDAIDVLQMEKVTLLFKKRESLIFVLFLDSELDPSWCRGDIENLVEHFYQRFPEILWQTEIVNLAQFAPFEKDADLLIGILNKKLELIVFLFDEGLVTEEEFLNNDLNNIGAIVGTRLLEVNYDLFIHSRTLGHDHIYSQIDNLLIKLNGEHVERELEKKYVIDCGECFMCDKTNNQKYCFFEGFLETLISALRLSIEVSRRDYT